MPKFAVYYSLTHEYELIVEADSLEDAYANWSDEARWDSEPEVVNDYFNDGIDIEEIV